MGRNITFVMEIYEINVYHFIKKELKNSSIPLNLNFFFLLNKKYICAYKRETIIYNPLINFSENGENFLFFSFLFLN